MKLRPRTSPPSKVSRASPRLNYACSVVGMAQLASPFMWYHQSTRTRATRRG